MKKLFTVSVEFEYSVMAEDEREALDYADDVVRDMSGLSDSGHATVAVTMKPDGTFSTNLPSGWSREDLVYGVDNGDQTLAEAIDSERRRLLSDQTLTRQMSMLDDGKKEGGR